MTGIRGDRSMARMLPHIGVTVLTIMLLAGCATASPQVGAASSGTPAPTPTAACPLIEGVEPPPDCAPYDPEKSMALNDRHRERMGISDDARAAAEEKIDEVRPALEALRSSGELSTDAVADVFADAGMPYAQTLGDERAVAYGVTAPLGGCIFGEVSADVLTIEAGGYIMDGGCLPAQ